tara:strand:+ start:2439 stop:3503 length:1065 start_codon:yes stop_codon:yes gene_type:complete
MAAGSKVEDDKQEYALSTMGPSYVSPSGHEFSFYDTEGNERVILKHATGSAIEFKADGSVFIKAVKDLHFQGQGLSDQAGTDGSGSGADHSTIRFDTNLLIEVGGRLGIKCNSFDLESSTTTYMKSGTDTKIESTNIINKATEQVAIESSKSIYLDSKEKRERFVSTRMELGTEESPGGALTAGTAPVAGINVINVKGNYVLENSDPSGGITISAAGYLNFVAGAERVDITGKWGPASTNNAAAFMPGMIARPFQSTFTNLIFNPVGDPKMQYNAPPGTGGSYTMLTESSAVYNYATTGATHPLAVGNGYLTNVMQGNTTENTYVGNRFRTVAANEGVVIGGIQRIQAQLIFLN